MIQNNFIKMKVQYITKKSTNVPTTATKKDASTSNNNTVKIDIEEEYQLFANTAKENAEKIKLMTEELKNLTLPRNATADEINDFIAQVNAMRIEASELYGQLDNLPVKTKCPEYSELVKVFQEFRELALSELEYAQAKLIYLNTGSISSKYTQKKSTTPQKDASTSNNNTVKFDIEEEEQLFANTAKENAEKIKLMTEELKNLTLPRNATADEINDFIAQVDAMEIEASELYGQLHNLPVKTKCPEFSELVKVLQEFRELASSKLEYAQAKLIYLNTGSISSKYTPKKSTT